MCVYIILYYIILYIALLSVLFFIDPANIKLYITYICILYTLRMCTQDLLLSYTYLSKSLDHNFILCAEV